MFCWGFDSTPSILYCFHDDQGPSARADCRCQAVRTKIFWVIELIKPTTIEVARYMVLSGANEKWAEKPPLQPWLPINRKESLLCQVNDWPPQKLVALQVASNIWEYYGLRGLWCLPERSADVSMWSSEAWRSCLLHPKKAMRWLAKGCEIQNVLDRWYIGSVGDFVDWGALGLTCVRCRIWLKMHHRHCTCLTVRDHAVTLAPQWLFGPR